MSDQHILGDSDEMVRSIASWLTVASLTGRFPSLEAQVAAIRRHLQLGYRVAQLEDLGSFSEPPSMLEVPIIKEGSRIIVEPNGNLRQVARRRPRPKCLPDPPRAD